MKKVLIALVLLLPAFLVTGCIFKFPKVEKDKVETKPEAAEMVDSSAPDPTSDWKKYEKTEYHISFKYPADMEVKELSGLAKNFLQINLNKNQRTQVVVMVNGDYGPERVSEFVGSKPTEEKMIKGAKWYFFAFPQGWSNSAPFTAYQREGMGYLYSLRFNDPIIDELRDQIMGTVKVLP